MTAAMAALASLALVAGQTFVIYAFLILVLMSAGRRTMAQLTVVEFVTIALLGSAVETGMYRGSSSLGAGLASAATVLLANRGFSYLQAHVPIVRRALAARPVLLACHGHLIAPNLAHVGLTRNDVLAGIRRRGYEKLADLRYVVLETNGEIGVVTGESSGIKAQGSKLKGRVGSSRPRPGRLTAPNPGLRPATMSPEPTRP